MNKILVVAVREYIETVKTKTFLVSSILLPMLMILLIFGTEKIGKLAEKQIVKTRAIALVDHTGVVTSALQARVAAYNRQHPQRKLAFEPVAPAKADLDALRADVRAGKLYAYLVIPADVLAPPPEDAPPASAPAAGSLPGTPATAPAGPACELGRKDSTLEIQMALQKMLDETIARLRFERHRPPIDYDLVRRLETPVNLREVDVRSGQDTSGSELIRFMTPFAFMFLLFMGTMTISQGLLTSVIEEKSSRVVEVLLSAISPTQMMAGKILGMVGVGATLMLIWGAVGYGGAESRGMGYLVTPYRLTFVVLYFIPGFLLFSAFLAAVGAACNTLKEAQSMAAPLTLLTIVPMMLWWQISQNPNGILSVVLSYIPPITPFVMILRVCADPETPMVQIVSTLAILWLAVVAVIWLAGKVFRVGVLMYGKQPSFKELLRWLRYA